MKSTEWRKALASGGNGGNCVDVVALEHECACRPEGKDGESLIAVRDSKDPDGPHLHFTRAEWAAFTDGVKNGEFDDLLEPVAP